MIGTIVIVKPAERRCNNMFIKKHVPLHLRKENFLKVNLT